MINAAIRSIVMKATTPGQTDRGRRLCLFGMFAAVTLGAVGGAYVAGRPYLGGLTTLALFVTMIALGMIVAEAFFSVEGLFGQRKRDLAAASIYDGLDADGPPETPFVLYLRPFSSTDALQETKVSAVQVQTGTKHIIIGTDKLEFETQIERAVRPIGTLVGLGDPLEHEGAGRIPVSDETWQDTITKLMTHAELIVMLPSPDGGTRWEVDTLLKSNRMEKTVIVDPPNAASRRKDYDPVSEWNEARDVFAGHGYTLPEDLPEGQLVYFGNEMEPSLTAQLSLDEVSEMRRFFKHVLRAAGRDQTGT